MKLFPFKRGILEVSYELKEGIKMYLTLKEAAEYLSLPEQYIESLIQQGKIRTVFDGEQYVVNKEQFNTHFEQLEKYKKQMEEYLSEPIPEDMDVKDED